MVGSVCRLGMLDGFDVEEMVANHDMFNLLSEERRVSFSHLIICRHISCRVFFVGIYFGG